MNFETCSCCIVDIVVVDAVVDISRGHRIVLKTFAMFTGSIFLKYGINQKLDGALGLAKVFTYLVGYLRVLLCFEQDDGDQANLGSKVTFW